ncbi:MAG: PaaI family thioesterase [Actinomycetota bacterium]
MDNDPAILAALRERVEASPFHAAFGVQVEAATEGAVRLSWEAGPEDLNLQGLVHGGLLATLADMAMGLAVRTALEPGRRHVTIELSVRYLLPTAPGRVTAEGRVARVGTQIAFADADVHDAKGRSVVRAGGTYSVTSERPRTTRDQ